MIVGQDWSSEESILRHKYQWQEELGQIPCLDTNRNLKDLLRWYLDLAFSDTYATDMFVFVKRGKMSDPIPTGGLEYCADKYIKRLIKIVSPKLVICLGEKTNNALRTTLAFTRCKLSLPWDGCKYHDADIVGVTHPGGQRFNRDGGLEGDKISNQWEFIARKLERRGARTREPEKYCPTCPSAGRIRTAQRAGSGVTPSGQERTAVRSGSTKAGIVREILRKGVEEGVSLGRRRADRGGRADQERLPGHDARVVLPRLRLHPRAVPERLRVQRSGLRAQARGLAIQNHFPG